MSYLNVYHNKLNESADTIVFLHDSLGCIELWRDFPEQLATACGMNVFIYDRRGYGGSSPFADEIRTKDYLEIESDNLMELLARNHVPNPILFGHSDGATIALFAAAKYPEQIKAVFSEAAHVFVEEISLDGIRNIKDQYLKSNLKERLQKYHGDKTEDLFYAWTETWLSPLFSDWNMDRILPEIQCPVMIIQGTEDEFGSMEQVKTISEMVSGPSEICIVLNAGHSPHKQNGIWLIDQCLVFLEKYQIIRS